MIDLSKNQRSIDTSGAHVDGGDVEALRAQFERKIREVTLFPVQRHGDSYIHRICALAWECYQAGHAAAKAETAAAVAAERERCLRIVQSVDNYSNPMPANDCAAAIRAGEKGEPS